MSEVIDLKDALERVQDDKELLLELFDIFQEDFPGKRNLIWAALAKGDVTSFQQVSHGLKGATGNISARKMHEICIELDRLAKDGKIAGTEPQLKALDAEYEAFKAEALRLKKEFGK